MVLCLVYLVFYSGRSIYRPGIFKPATNDHYNYIAINEVFMWVSNNGDGSHDPNTDGSGFYWPGGRLAQKAAIFEDGLIWGAIINGDTIVNGNTHRQGLQAGKILPSGTADDPNNPRYRVYKIRKGWEEIPHGPERDAYERDFYEWPVSDGAPWEDIDNDHIYSPGIDIPDFTGDEVMWYVANDLDTLRSLSTYASDPIGLEQQTTVVGISRSNLLGNIVYKKYLMINKGSHTIEDMYFGYYSDSDMGDANDDFVGCDTSLNLGYTWNSDNEDGDGSGVQYGMPPPAVGHMLVQGPYIPGIPSDSAKFNGKILWGYKNLKMTSFTANFKNNIWLVHDPPQQTRRGARQYYNLLQGKMNDGSLWINPITGDSTIFPLSGDPVESIGWYEGLGWPGGPRGADRRLMISSGPFTMLPGDSQEVVIAIVIARGEDYLDSITELRKTAQVAKTSYEMEFESLLTIDNPHIESVAHDRAVTLYWDSEIESYDMTDPFLVLNRKDDRTYTSDSTYTFEGYRFWQFRDKNGTDPQVLATYDIYNDVIEIYGRRIINGFPAEVVEIVGSNDGVRRSYTITESRYDQQPLNNGNPYYFAVTAYAYSEYSDPYFIESEPQIIEVIPGLKKIDQTSPYEYGEKIIADHISGDGHGMIELVVIDNQQLTGDEYQVTFIEKGDDITYSLVNHTLNDTILSDCTFVRIDSLEAPVMDGFQLLFKETGQENQIEGRNYVLRSIEETVGPGGLQLDTPVNVFYGDNSTRNWEIVTYGSDPDPLQNINVNDQVGLNTYQIRFTAKGSEYYLTGTSFGFQPWRDNDRKADDRIPFEIWDLGTTASEEDDVRLSIKTLDNYASIVPDSIRVDQDGKWSQLENGNWEPIFAFFQDSLYEEPLPETSGRLTNVEDSRLGKIIIRGELPQEGTVIEITPWRPLTEADIFSVRTIAANKSDYASAKNSLNDISVFPNPYFGFGTLSGYIKQDFVRFTNVPTRLTLRIFSLGGTFVRRIDKNDDNPWLDWDLRNNSGEKVASGVYIAHLEMPNIGEKVMKIAVILENQR
jgi:hypothetical protein